MRIALIDADPILIERTRASLARSPFIFLATPDAASAGEADLLLVPAASLAGLPRGTGIPTIAHGPPHLLRSAFLAGCADYLRDPWTAEELAARALAVLARVQERFAFPWGELAIEGSTLLTPAGPVALGAIQSRILRQLLASRGQPVPRAALALCAWGRPARASSRALDMHVASLRRKVTGAVAAAGPRFITAVRGEGYMIP